LTTILVTHAAHRLSYADHIIALGSNGTVAEQGKFEQLTKSGGYVAGLAARHMKGKDDQPKSKAAPVKAEPEKDTARDNAEADLNRPMGSWAIYRYYFESVGWRNLSVWIVLMICYSLLTRFPGIPHIDLT
jgi:ATP-binding cassette, subfamily C (CFTR/MRP), member 1